MACGKVLEMEPGVGAWGDSLETEGQEEIIYKEAYTDKRIYRNEVKRQGEMMPTCSAKSRKCTVQRYLGDHNY